MAIQILQDLSLFGGFQFLDNKAAFPANPSIGTIVLKEDAIYAYIVVGGLETWYPFSSRTSSYIHTQGLANTVWTVTHNLGTTDVWLQAKDADGRIVSATMTVVDENTARINFTSAITGTVILVAASSINVPEVKATVVNVGPDVQINTTGVRINGSYALTGANITEQVATIVAAETASLQSALNAEVTARQAADAAKLDSSAVGTSVASLVSGKVPASQLPSYVDDVIESATLAALPVTGETGKIYVTLNTNKQYRWSGSAYVELVSAPGTTDSVTEGSTNLYFTDARAQSAVTSVSGNAGTATKLATARNIAVTGAVSGSGSFDGSSNLSIATTLAQYTVPYDIAGSVFGVPAASEVIIRFRAARAFNLPASQTNAQAKSGVAATGSSTFVIAKNGSSIGTIVFGAAGTTGTFTFASSVNVAVGDLITVTAPATADATLADIDFTLVANA